MGRGCGTRTHGDLYFEAARCLPGDPRCRPIDYFILDPPWPIEREAMMIPDRGVALIDRPDGSGVVDVWDYVGSGSYPNVADVIEEGRIMGISRKAPKNGDYSKLDSRSCLILVHERAIVVNTEHCYGALEEEERLYGYEGGRKTAAWRCPRNVIEHAAENIWPADGPTKTEMCAGLWYEMVSGGDFSINPNVPFRTVERTVGDTCYVARRWFERSDEVSAPEPEYATGAFLKVPLGGFAVILEKDGSVPVAAVKAAARSALPFSLAEE